MEIVIEKKDRYSTIALIGKICTLDDYQQLKDQCASFNSEQKAIVFDLTRLHFSSTFGLGTLVSIVQNFKSRGLHCFLFKPQVELLSVITTMGIDAIVPIISTEEALLHLIV